MSMGWGKRIYFGEYSIDMRVAIGVTAETSNLFSVRFVCHKYEIKETRNNISGTNKVALTIRAGL